MYIISMLDPVNKYESIRYVESEENRMKSFEFVVTDPIGIHARPAGLLVKEAKKYESSVIMVIKDGKSVDAKKLMALMGLGVKCGDMVTVSIEGGEEEKALVGMKDFFAENL